MRVLAVLASVALAFGIAPAAAIEFENSRFKRATTHASAMVQAWQKGRGSARASGFFLANRQGRLLVATAGHVVGRAPVFRYRGIYASAARPVLRHGDFAVFEVFFGHTVRYETVGKLHIAASRPRVGQPLRVVGYPKGFSGSLMESRNCRVLPRGRLLHPTFFGCADLDRWCAYAAAADKSRATCRADALAVSRGRIRQCTLPLERRRTKHERHAESTHAMNCAVRLGSSGGPVILANGRSSRGVIGMPSAVFARVRGPFPSHLGVGLAAFDERFKARARRIGIVVR